MGPEVVNKNKNNIYYGDNIGRDNFTVNIVMFQDSEREFVVTHDTIIKPVAYFTGRETELHDLRQRIEEGRKSVLVSGMGGIGKTHICRKLFEEFHDKNIREKNGPFRYIGYIEYDGDMDSSLQNCLKFKHQNNPKDNVEAAWRELEYLASNRELLLFVDNVNVSMGEDSSLKRLMSIPGAIVLSSRRRVFSKEFEPYRIGFLSTEKCREMYEKICVANGWEEVAEEEVPDLDYIIETLTVRHTITVEFLAHLASKNHWTVQELRSELVENGFQLEYMDEEDKLVNIQKAYETLYDMSALTLAEQNILEAFSVFPYIPLASGTCNEWLLTDAGVHKDDNILMGLYQKGWLQFDVERRGYALHPVFAQFIYDKCKPELENHLNLIEACKRRLAIPESGSASECRKYVPFAENMIKKLGMENNLDQIDFISELSYLLYYIAEYKKAEALYEKSLRLSERVLGEEHLSTATGYHNLAMVYDVQGEYRKAEALYEKSLRIKERVLGEEHLDTAISYHNLALVYYEQGEYEKAEELYEKSLRISERILGEEHLSTATGYHNLAVAYYVQGEYGKAEKLYEKSLWIREKVLGEEHPDTAASYNSLAGVYQVQGKYKKAKELYKKSLMIKKKVLGEDHPSTAGSYNNLALMYKALGRYREAEEMCKKSLSIRERVLGEEHPDTVVSYNNLAGVYWIKGEYGKAGELYEKSLHIRERVLGEDHPSTATSYHNLASVYHTQGEYEKAEELYEKSLHIRERMLGEEHPDTASSYHNLAEMYCGRREYQKAMTYYLKAFNIVLFRLGTNHPNTRNDLERMKIAYYRWNPEGNFNQWLEEKMKDL